MLDAWCEAKGIDFVGREAEEDYQLKARRVAAVLQWKVPVRLLFAGSPQGVKDCVKMLIDGVEEGGGLMVDCGVRFDEAKPENVKAMVDFAKEYGVYSR